jgi:hypothetical protein
MTNTVYASGATGVTVEIRGFVVSNGLPYTAGAFNTAGITAQFIRNRSAATAITLVTQTAAGAWASGGFVHVAGGVYRLDVPNAAFATGADDVVIVVSGITDVTFSAATIDLAGSDPRAAAHTTTAIADAFLDRDMAVGTDSGSATVRTVRQALRALRNRFVVSGGTVTVYKENDSTTSHTAVVTGTPAVTEANPAGGS